MSSQKSFTPTGFCFDDVDALETIRRETAESAMDDAAFFKASDRPDQN